MMSRPNNSDFSLNSYGFPPYLLRYKVHIHTSVLGACWGSLVRGIPLRSILLLYLRKRCLQSVSKRSKSHPLACRLQLPLSTFLHSSFSSLAITSCANSTHSLQTMLCRGFPSSFCSGDRLGVVQHNVICTTATTKNITLRYSTSGLYSMS